MSWMITEHTANHLKLAHASLPAVQIFSSDAISITENDELLICTIGRVRSYNSDYPTNADCSWLLPLLSQQPLHAMSKLAGFFLLISFNK